MKHQISDLDTFRSVEEYATYTTSVDERLKELDAERPGQPLTDEARAEFAELQDIRKESEARSEELRNRKAYLERLAKNAENTQAAIKPIGPREGGSHIPADPFDVSAYRSRSSSDAEYRNLLRDGSKKVLERATFPNPNVKREQAQEQIERLIDYPQFAEDGAHDTTELSRRILVTGSPAYRSAFNKYITGRPMDAEETRAAALAVVGTTTTGGYAVPYVFDPTIIAIGAHTTINPYRAACRVEQIVGGNNWRAVTATAVTASYKAEAAPETEQGPTFGQPTFTVQRASAFATISYETLEDRPDISSELAVLIQEAKDTNEESQFAVGVGSTVFPFGMCCTLAYTATTTITSQVFAAADLQATEVALPIQHRANAAWFFSRAVIRVIQGFETAYGQYFNNNWPGGYPAVGNPQMMPTGNTGMRLLGYPVWESPSIPVGVTSAGAIIGALVNPSTFVIVDRIGMNIEVIPNLFGASQGNLPTGQRGVYAIWRNTARPVNVDGGRQITVHA